MYPIGPTPIFIAYSVAETQNIKIYSHKTLNSSFCNNMWCHSLQLTLTAYVFFWNKNVFTALEYNPSSGKTCEENSQIIVWL